MSELAAEEISESDAEEWLEKDKEDWSLLEDSIDLLETSGFSIETFPLVLSASKERVV